MAMWLAALEAEDGSWDDDPLPTDGTREMAADNARAMWPLRDEGQSIVLYRCDYDSVVEVPVRAPKPAAV